MEALKGSRATAGCITCCMLLLLGSGEGKRTVGDGFGMDRVGCGNCEACTNWLVVDWLSWVVRPESSDVFGLFGVCREGTDFIGGVQLDGSGSVELVALGLGGVRMLIMGGVRLVVVVEGVYTVSAGLERVVVMRLDGVDSRELCAVVLSLGISNLYFVEVEKAEMVEGLVDLLTLAADACWTDGSTVSLLAGIEFACGRTFLTMLLVAKGWVSCGRLEGKDWGSVFRRPNVSVFKVARDSSSCSCCKSMIQHTASMMW